MRKPRPLKPAHKIGRKQRLTGWTLIALGLLVAGVWVASGWGWRLYAVRGIYGLDVRDGQVDISRDRGGQGDSRLDFRRDPRRRFAWVAEEPGGYEPISTNWCLYIYSYETGPLIIDDDGRELGIRARVNERGIFVLWPLPLLLWTSAALLLRSSIIARRRATTGQCPKCGYSLAGLADSAACPECGKGAAAT